MHRCLEGQLGSVKMEKWQLRNRSNREEESLCSLTTKGNVVVWIHGRRYNEINVVIYN